MNGIERRKNIITYRIRLFKLNKRGIGLALKIKLIPKYRTVYAKNNAKKYQNFNRTILPTIIPKDPVKIATMIISQANNIPAYVSVYPISA